MLEDTQTKDFSDYTKGMNDTEIQAFIEKVRTGMQTAANEIAQARNAANLKKLQEQYEAERDRLSQQVRGDERVWRMSELKQKYSALGLKELF
jgi:TATA-binding protein-associated factor Taf7